MKQHMLSLLSDIVAYLTAAALYLLVRFYGTKDVMDWATDRHSLLLLWAVIGVTFGLFYWLITLVADSRRLRSKPYHFIILFKTAGIALTTVVIVFISRVAAYVQGSIRFADIVPSFLQRLSHQAVLAFFIYVVTVCVIYSLIQQMKVMVGGRVLFNLILGKYHDPREEERIFMFLDLKYSTTYAERLGHTRFCRLIQDCFIDLTDSAVKHKVEIYQYVGDEAILTWLIRDGLENANCVNVFFDFERSIKNKFKYYGYKYGIVPEFKAGVNIGKVTAAEVGILKRDIAYLSDVLNTASRIQGKCNEMGKKLLISSDLKNRLPLAPDLRYEPLGPIPLKGKDKNVDIYSVEKAAEKPPAAARRIP